MPGPPPLAYLVKPDWLSAVRQAAQSRRDAVRRIEVAKDLVVELGDRFLKSHVGQFVTGFFANFFWNYEGPMPWGKWLAGAIKTLRVAGWSFSTVIYGILRLPRGPLPLFNNGFVGRLLAKLPLMGGLAGPTATLWLTRLSIWGGILGGVAGTIKLIRQGNPIDAYDRDGAGYLADVAGTAFSFSSAAFFAFPNPVTGALAAGTGVVWLGAEAWDHRQEIADAAEVAADWVGDQWDAAMAPVDSAIEDIKHMSDLLSGRLHI